jgi:tetratricopeptide (TPR) repeat protein
VDVRRSRRIVGGVALGAAALLLGTVQLASTALYGDLARPPAVPPAVPPAWGVALGAPLAQPGMPAFARIAYAQALLHRGDDRAARHAIAGLPPSRATADLRGQLAQRAGDQAGALDAYAQAGDFTRAQVAIDALDRAGRIAPAVALERRLTRVLGSAADAQVRAVAWWRTGQLEQELAVAQHDPAAAARSLAAYRAALALAPNEETYLLAAGQQALTLGDRAAAAAYYTRALDAVPDSAAARDGLQRAR